MTVKVMGIVNVTPDSFSDGGRWASTEAAADQAMRLVEQGAEVLDVGGESTRPGAEPVSEAEEIDRVVPVIEAVRARWGGPISVDTMKPAVARAAVAAGATMWNDVTALSHAPDSAAVAAELGCEVVLMHMRGEPRTMQADPQYEDVVAEVRAYLLGRAEAATAARQARKHRTAMTVISQGSPAAAGGSRPGRRRGRLRARIDGVMRPSCRLRSTGPGPASKPWPPTVRPGPGHGWRSGRWPPGGSATETGAAACRP